MLEIDSRTRMGNIFDEDICFACFHENNLMKLIIFFWGEDFLLRRWQKEFFGAERDILKVGGEFIFVDMQK